MSISVTSLKRLCRQYGVKRWPHRQLTSVNRSVLKLEEYVRESPYGAAMSDELQVLYSKRDYIINVSALLLVIFFSSEERRGRERGGGVGHKREHPTHYAFGLPGRQPSD